MSPAEAIPSVLVRRMARSIIAMLPFMSSEPHPQRNPSTR